MHEEKLTPAHPPLPLWHPRARGSPSTPTTTEGRSSSPVFCGTEGPALKNRWASFPVPPSTWYSEALENGKRRQIWQRNKCGSNVDLHCVHGRSEESHWDRSAFSLVKVRIGPTLDTSPLASERVLWQRHRFWKGPLWLQVTGWELEELDTGRTFTWSSCFGWSCGHSEPGAGQEAHWCSRWCLLLDWQASRSVYLVCVCSYYFV